MLVLIPYNENWNLINHSTHSFGKTINPPAQGEKKTWKHFSWTSEGRSRLVDKTHPSCVRPRFNIRVQHYADRRATTRPLQSRGWARVWSVKTLSFFGLVLFLLGLDTFHGPYYNSFGDGCLLLDLTPSCWTWAPCCWTWPFPKPHPLWTNSPSCVLVAILQTIGS